MTFDREPDLDNANVGMHVSDIIYIPVCGSFQIGGFRFSLPVEDTAKRQLNRGELV